MLIQAAILAGLIKYLGISGKPITCSILYAVSVFFFDILFHSDLKRAILTAIMSGLTSFVYFWLLNRTADTLWWWVILIIGFVIIFI